MYLYHIGLINNPFHRHVYNTKLKFYQVAPLSTKYIPAYLGTPPNSPPPPPPRLYNIKLTNTNTCKYPHAVDIQSGLSYGWSYKAGTTVDRFSCKYLISIICDYLYLFRGIIF